MSCITCSWALQNMHLRCGLILIYLTNRKMEEIEKKIKSFIIPADCGRLPSNISSSYGSFTASQWRNWITIYSPVVLKGILPNEHLRCWLLFVKATQLLCHRIVRVYDVVMLSRLICIFYSFAGNLNGCILTQVL